MTQMSFSTLRALAKKYAAFRDEAILEELDYREHIMKQGYDAIWQDAVERKSETGPADTLRNRWTISEQSAYEQGYAAGLEVGEMRKRVIERRKNKWTE